MRAIALLLLLTGISGPGAGAASELVLTYIGASSTSLENPHDLELASAGDIWLADAGNDRIVKYRMSRE